MWRRKWQPLQVFLPEKYHGQRRLADYSPWGHNKLEMTEQLALFKCMYNKKADDSPPVDTVQMNLHHIK